MSIVIIVEDGSNVVNANSYQSVSQVREYVGNRGVDTSDDADCEIAALIIKAMDYIEAKECLFQGARTYGDQSLSHPRTGVYLNCKEVAADAIPSQLKGVLCQLVMAQYEGINILPNTTAEDYVTGAKVGPLSVTFADPSKIGTGDLGPNMAAVDALLSQLYGNCQNSGFSLRSVRI